MTHALILAALSIATPALAQESPGVFLTDVLAHYTVGATPDWHQWLSPSLVKLVQRAETDAAGEADRLDMDPVCMCQDIGLEWHSAWIGPVLASGGLAVITVELPRRTLYYTLIHTSDGWRIDDVREADGKDVREILEAGR